MASDPEPVIAAPDHDVRTAHVREAVRNGLWAIPSAFVAGAIALAVALRAVDRSLDPSEIGLVFDGDASSAQALLGISATAIITFTSLVLSVTVVALQLASQQFSPRVLRTFFRDTGTKVALGIFLGTFVYTLVVLRQVHTDGSSAAFVPRLSITVAFALVLASLGAFLYYVHHVVHAIRIVSIVDAVAAETRAAIRADDRHPDRPGAIGVPDREPDLVLLSEHAPGAVITIDEDDLVALAARHACLIRLVPRMGEFVPSTAPLAEVWGDDGRAPTGLQAPDVLAHIGMHRERTMQQDVAFGFRQLVDIAEKALSPAVNDPTTAVQVLDRLHDLLRRLAVVRRPTGHHRSADGRLRLVHQVPSWDGLVGLALDEIRHYGAGTHQVQRRMRALLDDLETVVDGDGRTALTRQRQLLDEAAARHFPDPADRASATDPTAAL